MKSKKNIAVTSRSFSQNTILVTELKDIFENVKLNNSGQTLVGDKLRDFLKDAEQAIIGIEEIDYELLRSLPKLKLISKYGVGLNNIDNDACNEFEVKISFTPGANKRSVAEFTLLLILNSLRRIDLNKTEILNNVWSQKKGRGLYGKKIGILGMGNIGKELANLLQPFNAEVLFFDLLNLEKDSSIPENISQVSFKKLIQSCEIISIHLPLTSDTKSILGSEVFSKMKKDVILINTARGGIVDEDALFSFLKNNPESFASFDVFETEPAFNNKLLSLDNFFATSHRASLSLDGILSMGRAALEGLVK